MMPWKKPAAWLAAAAILICMACSGGSTLPKPGSPGYYWSSANAAYKSGDFVKTDEELQRILVGESDYTAKARAWDMVVAGGLAKGYAELAEVYDAGGKANRQNPLAYRKKVSELRALSGNMAMQLAENVHKFLEQPKEPNVKLSFAFPAGNAAQPLGVTKLSKGLFVQDTEQAQIQTAMLQRGVMQALCAAVGNGDDAAKTQSLFASGEAQSPRDTFLLASAKMLQEAGEVFTTNKLDMPNKLKIVWVESLSALKAVPETKETKALSEQIQKGMKKANLSTAI